MLSWLLGPLPLFAQGVGSTEQDVLKHYGAPQMEREQSGGKKLWIYSNGTRLVVANGVVVESNVSASQPAPKPDLKPRYTPPPPRPAAQEKTKAQSVRAPTKRGDDAFNFSLSGMGWLSVAVIVVGFVIGMIGGVWLIVVAFQSSILWGIAILLIPLVWVVFLITHWQESKKPFAINVLGTAIVLGGGLVGELFA